MLYGDAILTLPEACKVLRISEITMRRLLKDRKVPAHKVGGQWRFISEELLQWVREK